MNNKLTAAKIRSFNAAIGRFVLEWAGLELGVDLLVVILGRVLRWKEFPHDITTKLNKLEGNVACLGLAPLKARLMLSLIKEVKSLVPVRHDCIHGAMISHAVEKSRLTVTLARLLQPPKSTRRKPAKVTEKIFTKCQIGFTRLEMNCLI
jgi:hypothetical protein